MVTAGGVTPATVYPTFITCATRQSLPSSFRLTIGLSIDHIVSQNNEIAHFAMRGPWIDDFHLEILNLKLSLLMCSPREKWLRNSFLVKSRTGYMWVHNWHTLRSNISFHYSQSNMHLSLRQAIFHHHAFWRGDCVSGGRSFTWWSYCHWGTLAFVEDSDCSLVSLLAVQRWSVFAECLGGLSYLAFFREVREVPR